MRISPILPVPRRAVAPIISTILMVAITVVMAAVVFVLVSGMLNKPPPPPPAVTFESRDWTGANYTASVTAMTGVSDIPTSGLSYIVQDPGGETYFTGVANDSNTVNSVTVTLWYNDLDGNNRITPGDQVVIHVEPLSGKTALNGGVLQIQYESRQIANHGISSMGG